MSQNLYILLILLIISMGLKVLKNVWDHTNLYIVLNIIVIYHFSVSCNHHLTLESYFKYFDFLSCIECKRLK